MNPSRITNDHTAKFRNSQTLKASNDLFYSAFFHASIGIALVSLQGHWMQVNPALMEIVGYSEAELLQKTFQEITYPDDLESDLENVRHLLAGNLTNYRMKKRYFHKSGSIVWVLLSVSLAHDSKGNPLHFISQIQNITESKIKEEILIQRNALLESILNNSTSGYLIVDSQGRTKLHQNKKLNELFEIPPDIANDADYAPQLQWGRGMAKDPVLFEERVCYFYEHPEEKGEDVVELKNGRILDRYTMPILGEDGACFGRIWVFHDITKERHEQQRLEEATLNAMSADRAKSNFLSMMSHELRTPLHGILGSADLILSDCELDAETYDKAQIIQSSGNRLLSMIDQVLDYTQIEERKNTLHSAPFSLSELAWEVIRLIEPLSRPKVLALEVHIDKSVPGTVSGDAGRINQVLTNLVMNAVKFTREGTVKLLIECVATEEELNTIRFSVKDTGQGISDEDKGKIFLPFTQSDNGLARKHEGIGLGLAISHDLIEQMGGKLTLESELGKGSLFTFELLLPTSSSAKSHKPKSSVGFDDLGDLNANFSSKYPATILAVDDEPINLLLVSRVLAKLGYENVSIASNGEEALQLHKEEKFDIIFMDLQMPGIDGIATTLKIREIEQLFSIEKKAFVVALTANVSASIRTNCFQAGMDHYISKPFNTRTLAEAICAR